MALKSAGTDPVANVELELACGACGCFQRVSTCSCTAVSNKDASAGAAMGEVDGVVIGLLEDADQEIRDLWQQHRELEKKMHQLRGGMEAQAAKRRKVNLASPEAPAKAAADLQAAAAIAAEEAGDSQAF